LAVVEDTGTGRREEAGKHSGVFNFLLVSWKTKNLVACGHRIIIDV
jgi:hypothetical protein